MLSQSKAQDQVTAEFGKVSPADFAPKLYSIDSNANAVVIADVGSSEMVGNNKGWFSLVFKHYRRVHLLNKNGFDIATVEIPLFSEGMGWKEEISDFNAVTYNLETGKVVETKSAETDIFRDKINKNWAVEKFTFPNIKPGSIIEYQYTIVSDYLENLQPWAFQGDYPTLWSEYNLKLPSFFNYAFLSQGYQRFYTETRNESRDHFTVIDPNGTKDTKAYSFSASVTNYHWVIKDAPALKDEGFVSTVKNYIQKIEFVLKAQMEPLSSHTYLSSWTQIADDMLHSESFGLSLSKENGWLRDLVRPVIAGVNSPMEKAKKIYEYVRDSFTCTDYSIYWLTQTLKNVSRTRNGKVSEINLLLTAMLKYAGIDADPVILSTRSHGYTFVLYPIMSKFNYVICCANISGKQVFLDATRPRLGFGKLTPDCYNGYGRIINPSANAVEFSADSLMEKKVTSVFLTTDENGEMVGSLQKVPGYFESDEIRKKIKDKGAGDFFKEVRKSYGPDVDIIDPHIDSLDYLDGPVKINYDFKLSGGQENVIYINPMFIEAYKENPFKALERLYPVEMPYASDEACVFTMTVPDGYEIDELPKPIVVRLNDAGDGGFEYQVSQSNGTIYVLSRIILKKTYFQPYEYNILRDFFSLIQEKQSEQIVLKKKK